jgi:hypothetical protein
VGQCGRQYRRDRQPYFFHASSPRQDRDRRSPQEPPARASVPSGRSRAAGHRSGRRKPMEISRRPLWGLSSRSFTADCVPRLGAGSPEVGAKQSRGAARHSATDAVLHPVSAIAVLRTCLFGGRASPGTAMLLVSGICCDGQKLASGCRCAGNLEGGTARRFAGTSATSCTLRHRIHHA